MSKREQDSTSTTTNVSPSQLQREQQVIINKALDETRDNIKRAANETKKDLSTYAEQFTTLQGRAIETARDITEEYIESQREIINSFNQSVLIPYVENVVNRTITTPFLGAFSLPRTEVYTNTINSVVDNFVTATRLTNRTAFANVELINTSLQQARNNVREHSRIGVNAVKNFHEAANEVAKIGFSGVEPTTVSAQRRQ